jgi:hypothetical protein
MSDGESYRAILTDPRAEVSTLTRLCASNLGMTGDLAATVRWQYLEGPMAPGELFLLRPPAKADDAAIGCAGITRRELWSVGRPLRAAQFANFAIDRRHRTALPAITLQRAVKRHVEVAWDLGFGFPNRSAIAVYRRVGYHELGELVRYGRVLRHAGYVERALSSRRWVRTLVRGALPLVASALGAVVDAGKRAVDQARALRSRLGSRLTWLDDVDPRFDELWRARRDTFGITAVRDAAFLRWRFLRKPDEPHVIAALTDRATGALRAYAIVRGRPGHLAEIADVFGGLDALDALFALLVPALRRRGHTAASLRYLGDPRLVAVLGAHGFLPREVERIAVVHAAASCPLEPATVRDPASWYLTELDIDS